VEAELLGFQVLEMMKSQRNEKVEWRQKMEERRTKKE
jgi:hypothetical protein